MSNAEKFWDKTAEKYAKSPVGDEKRYQQKLAETQEFLSPEMRILEFGCGTGTTAIHHAPHVAHIDAVDLSENMLDIARKRADEANVSNITFTRGTLTEFNGESEGYDVVLGLNVLHLIPNRLAEIAEVARILKPGGIFVSSTVCAGQSILRFIKYLVPLGKLLGLMPDVYVMTEAELNAELADAGFVIERQWRHAKDGIAVFTIVRKS